jgi:DNA repair protein RecN (Recombination protein N)
MLRLLSIRNFVVVDSLELELDAGFSVLTGETGAGKSILLDALTLLIGDRFEPGQLRAGAERCEIAAVFDVSERREIGDWLVENGLPHDEGSLLVRRTQERDGRSRAWINARPVTLGQCKEAGESLVDLHGQHAHQALLAADAQRELVDAFGGFSALARETAAAWRRWNDARERRDAALQAASASSAERERLEALRRELSALAVTADEWEALERTQSRLAHAQALLDAASTGVDALADGDDALARRLATVVAKLAAVSVHDAALDEIAALLEPARIQIDEAARALRRYRERLDLDPAELARVEERLAAIHDTARKHRVRPEALPQLLADTERELAALAESADLEVLGKRAAQAEASYRQIAGELSGKRRFAANELATRVTEAMQQLAMAGGRFEVAVEPLAAPASYGVERCAFRVNTHPKQPLGPLGRVASGGELSRIALAIQVVTSEVGDVPTLIFDEVDAGIGGTVAANVGRLLQSLGGRRQVLCVTHLPQVAAFADHHFRVVKRGDAAAVRAEVERLGPRARIDELARMMAGTEITAKTRAHARELLEQHQRAD